MIDDHDSNGDRADDREALPAVSRIGRSGGRSYRSIKRPTSRYLPRDRFPRAREQLPIDKLIGGSIHHHGLTDEVRQQCVCLYWFEIAGERIASRTFPMAFVDGVLQVSATTSSWVHEMQFYKANLITQINTWVDGNRVWLGPPPLVTDIRCVLAGRHRDALVDREHSQRLRLHRSRSTKPRVDNVAPTGSDTERDAILVETSNIDDPELRAVIESVRIKWNR